MPKVTAQENSFSHLTGSVAPIVENDCVQLKQRTNLLYLFLHDGIYLYLLYGNNVFCLDLMHMKVCWSTKLHTFRTPNHLFVNFFVQNRRYLYVVLPNEVIVIEKSSGTKQSLVGPEMLKKRERIKDFKCNDNIIVVLYGELILTNEKFNFSDNYLKEIDTDNDTNSFGISLDPPKLFLFDKDNNFIMNANGSNDDIHRITKPPQSSIFMLRNQSGYRIIDSSGKKIGVIPYYPDGKMILSDHHILIRPKDKLEW